MAIDAPPPRDVWTSVNYSASTGSEPLYMYASAPPPSVPQTNCTDSPQTIFIRDLRGAEHTKTLDNAGFQFLRAEAREKGFLDDALIRSSYYEDFEALVKRVTGAKRTFVFDHTVRCVHFSV
jgi:hypothetical protein